MAVTHHVERVSCRGIISVLRFLPAFQTGEFRTSEMLECPEDDCDCLPPTIRSKDEIELSLAVEAATKSLQDTLRNWGASREAKELLTSVEAIGRADELQLMKLLALHVRADRMVRGHLAEAIRSGHVAAILTRLDELHRKSREEKRNGAFACR